MFFCNSCGAKFNKWAGKCTACGEWNTITEEVEYTSPITGKKLAKNQIDEEVNFSSLNSSEIKQSSRIVTQIDEFDRVIGGGIVPGSAILISGEPGIGKSTLLLQIADKVAKQIQAVLYLSGEESAQQIQLRATRLGIQNPNIILTSTGNISGVLRSLKTENMPSLLIVDSIQTIYTKSIESVPGTVMQIRSATFELINFCKTNNVALIIVGHVTKEGQIAGPKLLEHMVDAVIYFEDSINHYLKFLRAQKNRFGSINEIGIFTMSGTGLECVSNPSEMFINFKEKNNAKLFIALEGTRSVMTEIEVLVANSYLPSPRRTVVGWDANRLAMILAILDSKCKLFFSDKDVYVSVASGFKLNDSGADLLIAINLIYAHRGKDCSENIVALGELSLSGEVRNIPMLENRIREALKIGCKKIYTPKLPNNIKLSNDELKKITQLKNIVEF